MNNLISHRFRGFAPNENTIDGLTRALDFGVKLLEFDIRAARCGTPMIYHDASAPDKNGQHRRLCDFMASDFMALGGTFARIPTAQSLFEAAAAHENTDAKLLIDVKDCGLEDMIIALVGENRLQERSVYVSWLPEVLFAIAERIPDAKLCLSHWCQRPGGAIRSRHAVFEAPGGHVHDTGRRHIIGETSGWYLDGPIKGPLAGKLDTVCVPQNMVTAELVAAYHALGIQVSTFSYLDWPHINDHRERMNIDMYFIDNKEVFDEAPSLRHV